MGAHFDSMVLKGTKEQVKKMFKAEQEQDAYENGHSYSGGWNMLGGIQFVDRLFTDVEEAEEWLSDNCEKWGNALAVKVPEKVKETAKMKELQKKSQEINNEIYSFPRMITERIRAQKSKLKACSKCESKVAVHYVRSPNCPVCNSEDFGYTETDRNKLQRLRDKQKELDKKLKDEKNKQPVGDTVWLIGGVLAS